MHLSSQHGEWERGGREENLPGTHRLASLHVRLSRNKRPCLNKEVAGIQFLRALWPPHTGTPAPTNHTWVHMYAHTK